MSARLNPGPLFGALIEGLRARRNAGLEAEERLTKLFLFGVPVSVAIVWFITGSVLTAADQLVAGLAIMVGALLATFSQLASWREKLTARAKKVDGVRVRSLDEAVAHVLVSVITAAATTGCLIIVSSEPYRWIAVISSGFAVAGMVNLLFTVFVVTNLLWDSYRSVNPAVPAEARPGEIERRR